ncbi:MAG: hypothetical protein ACRDNZ_13855 [Streptosporangiaceae bacterium]
MRHPGDSTAAGPSMFGPGYRGQRPAVATPARRGGSGRDGGGHDGGGPARSDVNADGTTGKGPVRGFPPAPGQPAPLYPPGQFAAWNRMSAARGSSAGRRPGDPPGSAAGGRPADGDEVYEPGYSMLAVSDPAADVTSTQTWQAIGDSPDGSGAWTRPGGRSDSASTAVDLAGTAAPAAAPTLAPAPVPPERTGPAAGPAGLSGRAGTRAGGARGRGTRAGGTRAGGTEKHGGSRARARAGARGGWSARAGRSSSTVLAVCAVLVVALAAVAFLLHAAQPQKAPSAADRSAGSRTATPAPSPTLGPFGHIATRAADPLPITVAQLFPDTFTVGGAAFIRATSEPGSTCASAVIGTALQAAVPARLCSQVVRASYLSAAEKAMGTIGVLNLSTAAAAARAGHAANSADYVVQLRGPSGPAKALGQGTGLEEAATKGHYLILIWAQFVNSAPPKSPAQQAELKTFMAQLFEETANVSLSNRMASGTP